MWIINLDNISFVISLVALFDLLRLKLLNANKLIWLVIIIFAPIIGSMLYFIIGKKYKTINR
ncbi:PLDc N-terminal domain-containing protein [Chondrinema litorale]|uniref:PLDc N-terminal domain-containing protein n=1 Tax=Chondrinema litorale TaxID=2994555 RepID=UPI003D6DAC7E